MKIDAHQHFWRYDAQRYDWITDEMSVIRRDFLPKDLLPELKANAIDASIAVQADQSEDETHFLLDLAAKHGTIAGVVGWIDLRADNLRARLDHFSQFKKLRGFRHIVQAEPDDRFMSRPDFRRGIAALTDHGFTYDILIYPKQLPAAIDLVEKFPNQRFVIDHIAKPDIKSGRLAPWDAQMKAIAAHPNVYCKVSGMVTETDWRNWRPSHFRPYLDVVFDAFGPDRVMFGSDWPVCLVAGSYTQVENVVAGYAENLPAADQAKIFGENGARFYSLPVNA